MQPKIVPRFLSLAGFSNVDWSPLHIGALVAVLVSMVLVPMPTPLVDVALALSLAFALSLFVGCLRVQRASDFVSFPALLLFSALFRLALNISTTRLILTQADAGRVVDAFSGVVVRSDLLIGAVVFGILLVVQIVVVARGSERIAEVTARFTLDALPGQQASIEAELRSGSISSAEASKQRATLLQRSNFYGAMDGAVRFVKNDAMAGLLITAMNLFGGLYVGIIRQGWSAQQSLEVYARLTIGDGLVAQIPSILLSMSAGILIARADTNPDQPTQIPTWLRPASLLVPSGLLVMLAMLPGMPSLAFLLVSITLGLAAIYQSTRLQNVETTVRPSLEFVLPVSKIPPRSRRNIETMLIRLQARLEESTGLEFPPFCTRDDPRITDVDIVHAGQRVARIEINFDDSADSVDSVDSADSDDTIALLEDHLLREAYQAGWRYAPRLLTLDSVAAELRTLEYSRPALYQAARDQLDARQILYWQRSFIGERIRALPVEDLLDKVLSDCPDVMNLKPQFRQIERLRQCFAMTWLPDAIRERAVFGERFWVRLDYEIEEELLDHTTNRDHALELQLSSPSIRNRAEQLRQQLNTLGFAVVFIARSSARPAVASFVHSVAAYLPVLSEVELVAAGVQVPQTHTLDLDKPNTEPPNGRENSHRLPSADASDPLLGT